VAQGLKSGSHKITIKMEGGSEMPCSGTIQYNTELPPSADKCKIKLEVKGTQSQVKEGDGTELRITIENRTHEVLPTVVAVIGLPGGVAPVHAQLKELVKAGKIAFYEIIGQEIILYWRSLQPDQKLSFPINGIADIPGSYTAAASRVYEYYTNEFKSWVAGSALIITPRN